MTSKQDLIEAEADEINRLLNDADFEAVSLENTVYNVTAWTRQQNGTGEEITENDTDELESYIDELIEYAEALRYKVREISDAICSRNEAAEEDED